MGEELPISEQVNVWREDIVETEAMLTQTEVLAGVEATFEGYFQVPLVIDK